MICIIYIFSKVIKTKYLCISMPAPLSLYLVPYFHLFSVVGYISAENCASWDKLASYLVQI